MDNEQFVYSFLSVCLVFMQSCLSLNKFNSFRFYFEEKFQEKIIESVLTLKYKLEFLFLT